MGPCQVVWVKTAAYRRDHVPGLTGLALRAVACRGWASPPNELRHRFRRQRIVGSSKKVHPSPAAIDQSCYESPTIIIIIRAIANARVAFLDMEALSRPGRTHSGERRHVGTRRLLALW